MNKYPVRIMVPAVNCNYAEMLLLMLLALNHQTELPRYKLTDIRPPGIPAGECFEPILSRLKEKDYEFTVQLDIIETIAVTGTINGLKQWREYPVNHSPETAVGSLLLYLLLSRYSVDLLPQPRTFAYIFCREQRLNAEKRGIAGIMQTKPIVAV